MKVARTYTIDHEIVEKMKNLNASDLINRLLVEHFQAYKPNNSLLDEKQAIIKQILKKKDRFLKRLKLLSSGMTLNLIILRKLGLKLVRKSQVFLKSLPTLKIEVCRSPQQNLKKQSSSIINLENC